MSRIHDFDSYEEAFNHQDRKAHRARKPRMSRPNKNLARRAVEDIAEATATEGEFTISYTPARHEAVWLLDSLRTFFDQDLLTDVLALVKGGKEANVYRCEGHPSNERCLIAAKVYRPRMFRNLRNDKMYREGRDILTKEGRGVKKNEHRIMRAVGKKTAYGVQVAHTSWLMYEYTTLKRLFEAGAAVPEPYGVAENTILMGYVGDERMAAPTLHEVSLEPDEARPLFVEVLRNIELMLSHSMIHGDLSAYNILYWEGKITIIDFPQVTNPQSNRNAFSIFSRDVERVCAYFERYGIHSDPTRITSLLWDKYTEPDYFAFDDLDV